jgi:hypothetical protein
LGAKLIIIFPNEGERRNENPICSCFVLKSDRLLDSPYLIFQRQFETPDGGRCYVETHDHGYVGHYRLKLIDFSPTHLVVAIERKSNIHIEVTYALNAVEFDQVQRVVNIIFDQDG